MGEVERVRGGVGELPKSPLAEGSSVRRQRRRAREEVGIKLLCTPVVKTTHYRNRNK